MVKSIKDYRMNLKLLSNISKWDIIYVLNIGKEDVTRIF